MATEKREKREKKTTFTIAVPPELHAFYKDTLQWDKRKRVADLLREATEEYAIKNGYATKTSD